MKNNSDTMVILLKTDRDLEWMGSLKQTSSNLEVRCWPDVGDPAEVDFALLWYPPEELFDQLTNLKVIFSIGAGVDGIINSKSRPTHIPLVRLSDQLLIDGMVEYVLYAVLKIHRHMSDYEDLSRSKRWDVLSQIASSDCRVGIMGLGQLGSACVKTLGILGYHLNGFSRTQKSIEGVQCFAQSRLDEFLRQTDILICLLPLTDQTRHILNKDTIAKLPRGASIINVGRGGHLNEMDLINAIKKGQIKEAVLDVFETEPLPDDHPFWGHPNITITPHVASQTVPSSAINHILGGIEKFNKNEPLEFLYDSQLGY